MGSYVTPAALSIHCPSAASATDMRRIRYIGSYHLAYGLQNPSNPHKNELEPVLYGGNRESYTRR